MSTVTAPAIPNLWLKLRGFRGAELLVLLFFAIVMALPIMFLLVGSFNTAAPGLWLVTVAGLSLVRCRITDIVTGSITVSGIGTVASA